MFFVVVANDAVPTQVYSGRFPNFFFFFFFLNNDLKMTKQEITQKKFPESLPNGNNHSMIVGKSLELQSQENIIININS